MKRIIQLLPTLSYGDAVGNDTIALYDYFSQKGYETLIYAENIDPRINKKIVKHYTELPELSSEDILLYHFSTDSRELSQILCKCTCRKVMIYHNITPGKFFTEYNESLAKLVNEGRDELHELKNVFECCIADSEYNKQDLIREGYTCPIAVLPILVPFEDYEQEPDADVLSRYQNDGWKNILFVGRIAPNKCQEDVIAAFAAYKKIYNSKSRLFIVGNYDGMEAYYERLQKYVEILGVEDIVFTGHISFKAILAYYCLADVFLCMSEHEGFCVPLLEAMKFEIPIIAYSSTAMPYTLGGAGILVTEKDPYLNAAIIDEVIVNSKLRDNLLKGQQQRLAYYKYETVARLAEEIFNKLINHENIETVENFKNSRDYTNNNNNNIEQLMLRMKEKAENNKMGEVKPFSDIPAKISEKPIMITENTGCSFVSSYYNQIISQKGIKAYIKKKLFGNLFSVLVEQEKKLVEQEKKLAEQEKKLAEQEKKLAEQEKKLAEQEKKLAEQVDKIGYWQEIPKIIENDGIFGKKEYLQGFREDVYEQSKDALYFNISNAFRGPENVVYNTVGLFYSYVEDAVRKNPSLPFVDFGCGRGEFLDILKEHGITCLGIDLNQVSAQRAIDHGHKVVIGDGISYLQNREDSSISGLSMIMVSEHIEFSLMFDAIFLFQKKIAVGGPLLINTINPYCFERYGNFHIDPSHINYLPPDTYKLVMEMAGFNHIKVIWTEPIRSCISNQHLHTQYENVTLVGYKK